MGHVGLLEDAHETQRLENQLPTSDKNPYHLSCAKSAKFVGVWLLLFFCQALLGSKYEEYSKMYRKDIVKCAYHLRYKIIIYIYQYNINYILLLYASIIISKL